MINSIPKVKVEVKWKALLALVLAASCPTFGQMRHSGSPTLVLGGASRALSNDFRTAFALTAECKGVILTTYAGLGKQLKQSGKLEYWSLDVIKNEIVERNREALASLGMKPNPNDNLFVWSVIRSRESGYSSKLDGGANTLKAAALQVCTVVKEKGGDVQ